LFIIPVIITTKDINKNIDTKDNTLQITKSWVLVLFITILASACSQSPFNNKKPITEKGLFQQAQIQLEEENYSGSIKTLEQLEDNFPFGLYGEQAQLQLIYAYYMANKYDEARLTALRFERLHPLHPNADYALYMRGVSTFQEFNSQYNRFFAPDMSEKNPGTMRNAFNQLSSFIKKYPNSIYSKDAQLRMTYLKNLLARREINIANFYFQRKAYLAAANRGKNVIENFHNTPAVADALAVMTQAYYLMAQNSLAEIQFNILKTNYPNHPSIGKNGEFIGKYYSPQRSKLNRLSFGLLQPAKAPYFDNREVQSQYQAIQPILAPNLK